GVSSVACGGCVTRGGRGSRGSRGAVVSGARAHVTDLVGQLVHDDAVPERDLADVGARTAVDAEAVAAFPHDLHGTAGGAGLLAEEGREAGGMGAPDGHAGAQPGTRELRTVLVGDD